MRTKSIALVIVSAALLLIWSSALGQTPQVQVQTPQVQVQRATLPAEPTFSRMEADDASATVVALPVPDLTINGMCLEHDRKSGWNSLRVTLGNIGKADAGPFEVGLVFTGPDGGEKLMTDKVTALKVGEEQSHDYSPICCGWSPTNFLVDTSVKFRAIADPKYMKSDPSNPLSRWEVKPVIRESNEKNNELTISKSELKPCGLSLQRIERPQALQIQVVRPPR